MQILDNAAADNRFLDNSTNIRLGDVAVPDLLRIDDDGRSELALIEAAGLVGANAAGQAAAFEFRFEDLAELLTSLVGTAAARMSRLASITTDEEMALEQRHAATRMQ